MTEKKQTKEDDGEPTPPIYLLNTFQDQVSKMRAVSLFGNLMRLIKKEYDINTFGLGKVMSAGILLLASGTKGQRRIGKHTRIMLHSITAGHTGALHSLENDIKETKWIQEQHIAALAAETKMTKSYINKMLNKKIDIYWNAVEALELGIADIIV